MLSKAYTYLEEYLRHSFLIFLIRIHSYNYKAWVKQPVESKKKNISTSVSGLRTVSNDILRRSSFMLAGIFLQVTNFKKNCFSRSSYKSVAVRKNYFARSNESCLLRTSS